jgi:predicted DNA-binding transcriptional regulator
MSSPAQWIPQIATLSKIEVLRILFEARCGLRLRAIAELANVSLRPIQLAIQNLEHDGFIQRERKSSITTYILKNLPTPLEKFFEAIQEERRLSQQNKNSKNSKSLGAFQEDAFKMIKNRKS